MSRPPRLGLPGRLSTQSSGVWGFCGAWDAAWPADGNPTRAPGTTVSLFPTETRGDPPQGSQLWPPARTPHTISLAAQNRFSFISFQNEPQNSS